MKTFLAIGAACMVAFLAAVLTIGHARPDARAGCGAAATWRAALVTQDHEMAQAIHTADAAHDYRTVIAQIDAARATLTAVPTRAADFWAAYEQGTTFIRQRMVDAQAGTPQAQADTEAVLALQDGPNATWAAGCRG